MKGKVLGFDAAAGTGAINGENGQRYNFTAGEFKSPTPAKAGDNVDFEADGANAKNIYVTAGAMPNVDLGEEVKAVVQPMPGIEPGPALEQELMVFCQQHLSRQKCPRSVDFDPALPRLPTGKLYKRALRDRYWAGKTSRIV
mgnify:CR=1 FL=1